MALRWKKNKPLTGLARIGAGPVGHTLSDGDTRYAVVSLLSRGQTSGWYWVAGWNSSVPHKNTCSEPVPDVVTAKAAAMDYVRQHMAGQTSQTTLPSVV